MLVLLYPQSQVYKMYPNEPSPLVLSEIVFLLPKTQVCIVNTDIVLVISNTSRGAVFSNYKQQNLNCKKEQYTLEEEFTTVSNGEHNTVQSYSFGYSGSQAKYRKT